MDLWYYHHITLLTCKLRGVYDNVEVNYCHWALGYHGVYCCECLAIIINWLALLGSRCLCHGVRMRFLLRLFLGLKGNCFGRFRWNMATQTQCRASLRPIRAMRPHKTANFRAANFILLQFSTYITRLSASVSRKWTTIKFYSIELTLTDNFKNNSWYRLFQRPLQRSQSVCVIHATVM